MRNLLFVTTLLVGCHSGSEAPSSATDPINAPAMAHVDHQVPNDDINPRLLRRFKPIRAEFTDGTPSTVAQVELGRQLFFDTRLSRGRDLSCNSCHHLDKYGVDNQPTSTGMSGQHGHRNSPSVYHAAGAFTSFWDGRAANVEEQAKGPILNPIEMGMVSPEAVVAVLAATPGYVSAFHAAFPNDANSVTYDNLGKAIGAFERRLVTPARWDKYLLGDHAALSRDEVAGFKVFTDIGCMTCHTGELIGGSMFQKVGVTKAWPNQTDRGRFEITKLPSDSMVFKVPSLRNVVKTGPYFHDGSVASLSEAVRLMGRHQIGEELTDEDVRVIVAWLGSLTGEIPADYIKVPTLPPDAVASRP